MDLHKLKSVFLKTMIGCLVAAALLAVTTILIGQFSDVAGKALFTIVIIALHCLISFGFILNNEKQETFENLEFFTNATFIIIVLSFITAVFGIWSVFTGTLVSELYALYFVLLFAILHGEILAKTLGLQNNINTIVYVNFFFMGVVVLMILPLIFLPERGELGAFFYRLLSAVGIIDATLTLIAVILHKLYVQKHPTITDGLFNVQMANTGVVAPTIDGQPAQQVQMVPAKRGTNIFVLIFIGFNVDK